MYGWIFAQGPCTLCKLPICLDTGNNLLELFQKVLPGVAGDEVPRLIKSHWNMQMGFYGAALI